MFNILPGGQVWSSPGLDELFRAGWAGSSRRHANAELSAVCAALLASCLSPLTLPGVCLSHCWLLLSLRDTVSPFSTLDPPQWTVFGKAVKFLVPVQLVAVFRLPISSWEAECRSPGGM